MHYKTIKFNIKIPLNIHNFHFLRRASREKLDIATLRGKRAEKFGIFLTFTPPPPDEVCQVRHCQPEWLSRF